MSEKIEPLLLLDTYEDGVCEDEHGEKWKLVDEGTPHAVEFWEVPVV